MLQLKLHKQQQQRHQHIQQQQRKLQRHHQQQLFHHRVDPESLHKFLRRQNQRKRDQLHQRHQLPLLRRHVRESGKRNRVVQPRPKSFSGKFEHEQPVQHHQTKQQQQPSKQNFQPRQTRRRQAPVFIQEKQLQKPLLQVLDRAQKPLETQDLLRPAEKRQQRLGGAQPEPQLLLQRQQLLQHLQHQQHHVQQPILRQFPAHVHRTKHLLSHPLQLLHQLRQLHLVFQDQARPEPELRPQKIYRFDRPRVLRPQRQPRQHRKRRHHRRHAQRFENCL